MTDTAPDPVAFPDLDDTQLAIVAALGERRRVEAGDVLFSPADDHYDFVVVLSGSVEILGVDGEVITRHGARRFLGEVSLVTRQRPYLTARVAEPSEIVVVPAEVFRSRVMTDVRLSDTVLEAFLARRAVLLSAAADTLKIVGQNAFRRPGPDAWIRGTADDRYLSGRFRLDAGLTKPGEESTGGITTSARCRRRHRRDHQPDGI